MSQNLTVARRFMEGGIATGALAVFDECLHTDVVVRTGLSPGGPIVGLAAYKDVFGPFARALPVVDFQILEIWEAELENKVAVRFLATAVFLSDFAGIVAQRQIVAMEEVHLLTFRDGRIATNVVSGTNFPFEYLMYPVLKHAILGAMRPATPEEVDRAHVAARQVG